MPKDTDRSRYSRTQVEYEPPPPEDAPTPVLGRQQLPGTPATPPPAVGQRLSLIPWRPLTVPQWLRNWLGRS